MSIDSSSFDAKSRFQNDGYVVVPSVFPPSHIEAAKSELLRTAEDHGNLAKQVRRIGGASLPQQAAAYPAARQLMFSDQVIALVTELLGEQPIYFGDSSVSFGAGYTGWHKDNRVSDRADGRAPDWQGDYDLVRVGIYLQDCKHHSGGLLIRAGSHRRAPMMPGWIEKRARFLGPLVRRINKFRSRFIGTARFVDSRPGDVVLWSLRTTHAGHAVRLRGAPGLLFDPRVQQAIPRPLRISVDGDRVAIFATFARRGEHFDRYREYIMKRDYFAKRPSYSVRDLVPSSVIVEELDTSAS